MEVKQTPPKEQRNPVMYVHSFRKAYIIEKRIIMKGVVVLLCTSRNNTNFCQLVSFAFTNISSKYGVNNYYCDKLMRDEPQRL